MKKRFLPSMYKKNIFEINYELLKKNGIKCLLFDVDNTISPAKERKLCDKTKKLFDKLKNDFKIILFSNNIEKRIRKFSSFYDVEFESLSLKPLYFKYSKILRKSGFKKSEIAAIGDQIVTDIYGGNKAGITTILVDPMSKVEGKTTSINRVIERQIINNYKKKNIFVKGKYYE